MGKPRVLLIGGKPFNVPEEFGLHFDLIRHIEQDERHIAQLPKVEYVVVLTNWVNHSAIAACRKQLAAVPIVWVNKGWNAMLVEFVRRGIIKPEPVSVPAIQTTLTREGFSGDTPVTAEVVPPLPPPQVVVVPEKPELNPVPESQRQQAWEDHVRSWVGKWTVELDRPAKEIIDCAVLEPKSADDFMNWLKITAEQAKNIWTGYLKSRANFCRVNGVPYEPTTNGRPSRPKKPATVPSGMGDLAAMIERVTKLTDQRGELGRERAALNERLAKLNDEFKKIDAEIEKLKPVLAAIDQLQRAVKATKEKA